MLYSTNIPGAIPGGDARQNKEFLSGQCRVFLNGAECQVQSARVSAMPFNRRWPGYQRPVDQTEIVSFILFEADSEIFVEAEPCFEFNNAVVRPLSKNIAVASDSKKVGFRLNKPGQYVLELDGGHNVLYVFYNPPRGFEEKKSATYSFGPGIHFHGPIKLKDNDTVYIDRDALVYADILGENVKNVRIFGHGIIDSGFTARCFSNPHLINCANIRLMNCSNVSIEGVTLRDSSEYVVSGWTCRDINIKNIKIIGQWKYNTDGIDFHNSKNVDIRDSFIRSFDDCVCIKGGGGDGSVNSVCDSENINVSNCVLWCDWGNALEIGLETACPRTVNITFEDCDIVHGTGVMLDIQNGDSTEINGVVFKNIRAEYRPDAPQPVIQEKDNQVFEKNNSSYMPALIRISNYPYKEEGMYYEEYFKGRKGEYTLFPVAPVSVRNIVFKDIYIYAGQGMPVPASKIISLRKDTKYSDITVDGVYFNGKRLNNKEEMNLSVSSTDNFRFI